MLLVGGKKGSKDLFSWPFAKYIIAYYMILLLTVFIVNIQSSMLSGDTPHGEHSTSLGTWRKTAIKAIHTKIKLHCPCFCIITSPSLTDSWSRYFFCIHLNVEHICHFLAVHQSNPKTLPTPPLIPFEWYIFWRTLPWDVYPSPFPGAAGKVDKILSVRCLETIVQIWILSDGGLSCSIHSSL